LPSGQTIDISHRVSASTGAALSTAAKAADTTQIFPCFMVSLSGFGWLKRLEFSVYQLYSFYVAGGFGLSIRHLPPGAEKPPPHKKRPKIQQQGQEWLRRLI